MKRTLYWGLAILILLLITAGVFLLTQRNTDTKPNVVFEPPSDKVIQQIRDGIAERNAQDVVKPPPPGKTFEGGGHWHGDVWHDAPHTPSDLQPIPSVDGPVKANADSMSDPSTKLTHWLRQYKKWAREYEKAHDEWVKAVEASNNYLKGKWTPEYLTNLSDTEKEQVAAKILELHEACLTANNKLDVLSKERLSFK